MPRYTEGSPLFYATGAVINWGAGDMTLTHATGTLTLAGGVLSLPAGLVSAPSLRGPTVANTGLFFSGTGMRFAVEGVAELIISGGQTQVTGVLALGSGADLLLTYEAAAVLKFGTNAAAPVTQTITGPSARAATDVDTVGGRINWRTGLSTGTGVPALQSLQGGAANVTSGSAAHAVVDRFIPNAFKVLTKNSAIAIVNVTVANNTNVGGLITYTIEVFDGTDVQVETGQAVYSTGAKGATVAGTITEINSQQNLTGGSTLATTWAITNAQPAVISINANPSLTPSTGYPRITYSIQNLGQQAIAIQ